MASAEAQIQQRGRPAGNACQSPRTESVLPLTFAMRRMRRGVTVAMMWMSFMTDSRSCSSCTTWYLTF